VSAWMLAGYLDTDTLRAVVRGLPRAGTTVILEGLTTLHMWSIKDPGAAWAGECDPAIQEEGWMFDADFELHWQRPRGYPSHLLPFRVRLITDNDDLLQQIANVSWQSMESTPVPVQELRHAAGGAFYLWGEAVRDGTGAVAVDDAGQARWYEKEVPGMFSYPIATDENARRVKIITKTYTLPVAQAPGLTTDGNDVEDSDEPTLLHRFVALIPTQE